MISAASSIPTDTRTSPAPMPISSRSATVRRAWLVSAGRHTVVWHPPRDLRHKQREHRRPHHHGGIVVVGAPCGRAQSERAHETIGALGCRALAAEIKCEHRAAARHHLPGVHTGGEIGPAVFAPSSRDLPVISPRSPYLLATSYAGWLGSRGYSTRSTRGCACVNHVCHLHASMRRGRAGV